MSSENESDVEKDLPPSERKIQKAMEDGYFLKVKELSWFIQLLSLSLGLIVAADNLIKVICNTWQMNPSFNFSKWVMDIVLALWPFYLSAIFAFMLDWRQSKFAINVSLLAFKFERLNGIEKLTKGFKQPFAEVFWPLIKGLVLISLCFILVWLSFKGMAEEGLEAWVNTISIFMLAIGLIIIVDFAFDWGKYNQKMMMSLQELKDEMKETEGNPLIKAKFRQIARMRAKKRMMQNVKNASVIIVNPEHYAVALKWEHGIDQAPIVIAKGKDELALKIKILAKEKSVPVFEAPLIARMLWKYCRIDKVIDEQMFYVVSVILAWALQRQEGVYMGYPDEDFLAADLLKKGFTDVE